MVHLLRFFGPVSALWSKERKQKFEGLVNSLQLFIGKTTQDICEIGFRAGARRIYDGFPIPCQYQSKLTPIRGRFLAADQFLFDQPVDEF